MSLFKVKNCLFHGGPDGFAVGANEFVFFRIGVNVIGDIVPLSRIHLAQNDFRAVSQNLLVPFHVGEQALLAGEPRRAPVAGKVLELEVDVVDVPPQVVGPLGRGAVVALVASESLDL
jgi:hypothetical protein